MDPHDKGLGTVRHLTIEPLGGDSVWWNICPSTQWGRFVGRVETLDTGGGAPQNPLPIQEQMILDVKLPWRQLRPLGYISDDFIFDSEDSGDSGGGSSHHSGHDGNGSEHVPSKSRDKTPTENQDGTSEDTSTAAPTRTEGSVGHIPVSPLGEANPPTYSPLPRPSESESEDIILLSESLSDEEIEEDPEEESKESIYSWATSNLTRESTPKSNLTRFDFDWAPVTRVPHLQSSFPLIGRDDYNKYNKV